MAKRNVRQQIQEQVLPGSIAPSMSAPQVPSLSLATQIRPERPSQELRQIMGVVESLGQFGSTIQRYNKAEALEESGFAARSSVEDRVPLVAALRNDTLDQLEISPANDQAGVAAVTMEDLLFNAIGDADTPEVGIQNWLTGLSEPTMSSFRSDDARDTYESGFYNPVLQAANDWYQGKLQEKQGIILRGVSEGLAANNDPVNFGDLRSETEKSEFVGTLSDLETSAVLVDAASVAVGMSRFSRANDLLDQVPESNRDANWYRAFGQAKEALSQSVGASVTSELMNFDMEAGPPNLSQTARFFGEAEQDPELVSALKVSVNTYAVNPGVMREDKLSALGQMLVTVSPFSSAWNEVSNAIARVPNEDSESQQLADARKENKYQAKLMSLELLQMGKVGNIDSENDGYEAQYRQVLIDKFGGDGRDFFNDYQELKLKEQYAGDSNADTDATAAGLLLKMQELFDPTQQREFMRGEVFTAVEQGKITFADFKSIMAAAEAEKKLDAFKETRYLKELEKDIAQTFVARTGTESVVENLDGVLSVLLGGDIDEAAARLKLRSLLFDFRNDYATWLRENGSLLDSDPVEFNKQLREELKRLGELYIPQAGDAGYYFSSEAQENRNNP
ncbi:MAG: hypothetical protein CMB34_06725 [Euryarchaeota archaeon]|nr:hypothetical protein [Euryarchaeota archaeon]|tara:strand:- start:4179 stop:6041 length:1863 start_codon:yes stop_codon:yes gene_type:complete